MFQECLPPQSHELAINAPGCGLHSYMDILAAQHNYWQAQLERAESNVDLGRQAVSKVFYDDLHRSTTVFYAMAEGNLEENDFIKEGARRTALGTLALSILFRRLWPTSEEIKDMRGERKADSLLDTHTGNDGLPAAHLLHAYPDRSKSLLPAYGDLPLDRWYRRGQLYIRRVRPAVPSTRARFDMQINSIAIDFKHMETLFPYVVTIPT